MTVHKRSRSFRVLALLLAALTLVSLFTLPASAAQEDPYHDPADHWLPSNNRTNELDANAVVTHETMVCWSCERSTAFTIWRTPEYARDGVTAMTRNVKYSDGTGTDEKTPGVILDGIPGKDARYTGSHWTKACCDTCGVLNANMDPHRYGYSKDVYWLYDCAAEFTQTLPETASYACEDGTYHRKTTAGGTYCGFCYGTRKTNASTLERHDLE